MAGILPRRARPRPVERTGAPIGQTPVMTAVDTRGTRPTAPDPVVARAPCGSEVDTDRGGWGLATATFDPTRVYRFRLSRVWDPDAPRICFVMCNPSTADASVLDPTVRRCAGFARDWGAGSFEVTNVFALRSTDPARLRQVADPVGPGNDRAIEAAASAADVVVCAWGIHAAHGGRHDRVLALLRGAGVTPMALAVTRAGYPGHPLYLPRTATPVPFP
jgi:hypothetical protein